MTPIRSRKRSASPMSDFYTDAIRVREMLLDDEDEPLRQACVATVIGEADVAAIHALDDEAAAEALHARPKIPFRLDGLFRAEVFVGRNLTIERERAPAARRFP